MKKSVLIEFIADMKMINWLPHYLTMFFRCFKTTRKKALHESTSLLIGKKRGLGLKQQQQRGEVFCWV